MKILITGIGGFVGSHLCDSLIKKNHEIIGIIRNKQKVDNLVTNLEQIQLENIDITNFPALESVIDKHNPDIIIHLAGEASHSLSFENPLYDVDVNAKSTLCILEKLRKSNLKTKFILGSSFIVVGKPTSLPITEETSCNPTTIYGANRLVSEHFCKIYQNVYGLDTMIFRITNSFGPREQFITPKKNAINYLLYRAFKGEEVIIYNNGEFFRDIIYIDDVISGINTLMNKGKSGNLYWISSGKKTWFYELGSILNQLTKSKIVYQDPPSYTKKIDVGNFLVDNSKLKSLGWDSNTSIKDGIIKTFDFFRTLEN